MNVLVQKIFLIYSYNNSSQFKKYLYNKKKNENYVLIRTFFNIPKHSDMIYLSSLFFFSLMSSLKLIIYLKTYEDKARNKDKQNYLNQSLERFTNGFVTTTKDFPLGPFIPLQITVKRVTHKP